ncbi:MAG TPA: NADH-quinone oxidoreductase subunit C, partial [Sphingobacteriaceae bacterium]
MISLDVIKSIIVQKFGSGAILAEEQSGLQPALLIHPEMIAAVCLELRDNPKTYFDFLSSLSGVDYGLEENKFGVVYHLSSIPYKSQITLKVIKDHDRNDSSLPA